MAKIKDYTSVIKQISDIEDWLAHKPKCCHFNGPDKNGQYWCDCKLVHLDVVNEFDLEFCRILKAKAGEVCLKCKSNNVKHKAEDNNYYHKKWDGGDSSFSEFCEASMLWQLVEGFALVPAKT